MQNNYPHVLANKIIASIMIFLVIIFKYATLLSFLHHLQILRIIY